MVKDTAPPHRYGPGYDILGNRGHVNKAFKSTAQTNLRVPVDPLQEGQYTDQELLGAALRADKSHSVGIRPHPHNRAIARQLLDATKKPRYQEVKPDDVVDLSDGAKFVVLPKEDKRPLIDRVNEATFTSPVGMQWFKNLYDVRTLIRKAKCFTLDDATSRMVAEFSIAIGHDLEAVRQCAIPPFPVTWIDLNNRARLDRMREMGMPLTPTAAGETEAGPPVERVGWLIHEAENGGWYMTYFCDVSQGVMAAPLSYWWHAGSPSPKPTPPDDDAQHLLQGLAFGMGNVNVHPMDAFPTPTPYNLPLKDAWRGQVSELMQEIAGELRHVWGLLLALNATSQFGVEAKMAEQPKHSDIRKMPNGKPLLPLEHKVLTLHLKRKLTAGMVAQRTIAHHKVRHHDVRGHLRTLQSGKVVPVKAHERGDKSLGRIEKKYKVER